MKNSNEIIFLEQAQLAVFYCKNSDASDIDKFNLHRKRLQPNMESEFPGMSP